MLVQNKVIIYNTHDDDYRQWTCHGDGRRGPSGVGGGGRRVYKNRAVPGAAWRQKRVERVGGGRVGVGVGVNLLTVITTAVGGLAGPGDRCGTIMSNPSDRRQPSLGHAKKPGRTQCRFMHTSLPPRHLSVSLSTGQHWPRTLYIHTHTHTHTHTQVTEINSIVKYPVDSLSL